MPATALQLDFSARLAAETLTAAQWAQLLDLSKKGFILRQVPHSGMISANGGLTKVYRFADLPADYQARLEEQRRRQGCPEFGDLVDLHRSPRFQPARELATLPPATQTLAEQRKEVLAVFWQSLENRKPVGVANAETRAAWLRMFNKACDEKTIRRWVAAVERRGGPDLAPIEAYAGLKSEDGKSVPHHAARLVAKLDIPRALIAEYKARCVQDGLFHIQAAYRSLEIDWQNGRQVPGLGVAASRRAPFPFTAQQLRPFAPSRPARVQGGLGNAAAARVALPHGKNTTAFLRRMEHVLLDDSRIDIIATDDLTGQPVELKSQFLIDLGPRRIESWVIREKGNLLATDTDAMLARAFRSAGLAAKDSGYHTTVRFERGAVACSAARESFLRGAFPGQLFIDRTGMEGGANYGGASQQSNSGRWMDKAHIESFMRTLAYFLQHVPGQRGGSYARQPAALGLVGKNRDKGGALDYTRGSQIHQAALLQYADRAVSFFEGDLDERIAAAATHQPQAANGRLKITSLYPVSWILDAVREFVAYYNSRTNHRLEGFRRIEYVHPETRALKHRQESPDERAAFLTEYCPTERISEACVSRLLLRARPVTVRRNGVTLDLAPFSGLRFWKPDSVQVHRAQQLATGELKMIALVDEDGLLHGDPSVPREIYLIGNKELSFKLGEPAQFLEALPLADAGVIGDPLSLAHSNAELEKVQNRYAAEMVTAAAPHIARQVAARRGNIASLQAVTVANDAAVRATMPDSPLIRALGDAEAGAATFAADSPDPEPPTRAQQMQNTQEDYAAYLASLD